MFSFYLACDFLELLWLILKGVFYVGVPCKLGKNGVEEVVEIKLTDEEKAALHKSADIVKKNFSIL